MILAVHSAEDCSASNMNPEFRKKVVPFIVNRITLALFTLSTLLKILKTHFYFSQIF